MAPQQSTMPGDAVLRVARDLATRFAAEARVMVAIAGPPGSGKSTFADQLETALLSLGETAAVLPMDGFHMDNAILSARGLLPRKGAPETFDVRGLADILTAVRRGDVEVLVPVFDRSRELAIAAARAVRPEDRFILCEGNYLLFDRTPWDGLAPLFDRTIMIAPPVAVLEERLMQRWLHHGFDEAAARAKVFENDMPNGRAVLAQSRPANLTLAAF